MEIVLIPVSMRAYAWLFGLTLAPLLLIGSGLRWFQPAMGFKPLALMVLLVLPITLGFAWTLRSNRLTLESNDLTLRASLFYRVSKPITAIDWSRVHAGNLSDFPEFNPALRTNGIGLPGYRAGWFRLEDGSRGALMLTDSTRTLVLPFKDGEVLIASVENPVSALKLIRDQAR